jgi:hypothetical protein
MEQAVFITELYMEGHSMKMKKKKSEITADDIFSHAEKIYQASIAIKYTVNSWPPENRLEPTLNFTPAYYVTTSFAFELLIKTLLVLDGHSPKEFHKPKYGHGLVSMYELLPDDWKIQLEHEFNNRVQSSPSYIQQKKLMEIMGHTAYEHQSVKDVLVLNNDRFKDFRYAYELSHDYMLRVFQHNDYEMTELINVMRSLVLVLKPELDKKLLNNHWVGDLRNNREPSPMSN